MWSRVKSYAARTSSTPSPPLLSFTCGRAVRCRKHGVGVRVRVLACLPPGHISNCPARFQLRLARPAAVPHLLDEADVHKPEVDALADHERSVEDLAHRGRVAGRQLRLCVAHPQRRLPREGRACGRVRCREAGMQDARACAAAAAVRVPGQHSWQSTAAAMWPWLSVCNWHAALVGMLTLEGSAVTTTSQAARQSSDSGQPRRSSASARHSCCSNSPASSRAASFLACGCVKCTCARQPRPFVALAAPLLRSAGVIWRLTRSSTKAPVLDIFKTI